ncbi:MAG: MarR family transcriptional regulator [Ferrovum sp. 37-45-19]|uniref:MarR family winged helix-turn-helix transcriptional regulator n=1 Tax=Ferrovum sp. JA12 TaxID=1356299 RepID=UPI0007028762|nr:MarR family transcriptional regulator [Ferrovum sp. JA12]OYV78762.1 MAG: MarR family transcriptional regulator [Ferrovum sp. 21-44-67]OYV93932.1 MAG: MarR family transcriptional regulator [Ferrovum sp. 37-45-19]OZB32000.1 MAG: MarR family transcriptional regulator [Ferrovum sp. 34-44-207]HQT81990.1 MarR family transcriptional regulator [Ferrovaceae bacterium]KRH78973.1 transcriptional repressor MprA [Ferrovum sp. JA12]
MLLLKKLANSETVNKFQESYPDADIASLSDFMQIMRSASDLSESLNKLLDEHALLQGRWWVLVLLTRQDDLTSCPSSLAEDAGVTKATMTGFISGLERDGYITRIIDPMDRRKYCIQLTQAGANKVKQVMPIFYTRVKSLMSTIDVKQRQEVVEGIRILSNNQHLLKS